MLCACSLQRTMRIWEYSTGKILKTLSFAKGQAEGGQQAAFVQAYNRTHFVYTANATPGSCAFSYGTLMRQLTGLCAAAPRCQGRGFTSCCTRVPCSGPGRPQHSVKPGNQAWEQLPLTGSIAAHLVQVKVRHVIID
jgi:hypothetical protein